MEKMRSNEEALEIFADILEPAGEIIGDDEVKDLLRGSDRMKAVKVAIKKHKAAIIEILARIDGVEPEEYKIGIFTLPAKVISLLNNEDVQELFIGQGQNGGGASSGSATGTITDGEA